MRWSLALCLALAGCSGSAGRGPAWPKSAGTVPAETWEEDGGQSLEPHEASPVESSGGGGDAASALGDLFGTFMVDPVPGPTEPSTEPAVTFDLTPDSEIVIEGTPPPPDPPPEAPAP